MKARGQCKMTFREAYRQQSIRKLLEAQISSAVIKELLKDDKYVVKIDLRKNLIEIGYDGDDFIMDKSEAEDITESRIFIEDGEGNRMAVLENCLADVLETADGTGNGFARFFKERLFKTAPMELYGHLLTNRDDFTVGFVDLAPKYETLLACIYPKSAGFALTPDFITHINSELDKGNFNDRDGTLPVMIVSVLLKKFGKDGEK